MEQKTQHESLGRNTQISLQSLAWVKETGQISTDTVNGMVLTKPI